MNAQVSLTIHLSLLKIDYDNLSTILLSAEGHETSRWDSHTGAHANGKVCLSMESLASSQDLFIEIIAKVNDRVNEITST